MYGRRGTGSGLFSSNEVKDSTFLAKKDSEGSTSTTEGTTNSRGVRGGGSSVAGSSRTEPESYNAADPNAQTNRVVTDSDYEMGSSEDESISKGHNQHDSESSEDEQENYSSKVVNSNLGQFIDSI